MVFKKRKNNFNTWVSSRGQRKKNGIALKKTHLSKSPVGSKALKLPLLLKNDYTQKFNFRTIFSLHRLALSASLMSKNIFPTILYVTIIIANQNIQNCIILFQHTSSLVLTNGL